MSHKKSLKSPLIIGLLLLGIALQSCGSNVSDPVPTLTIAPSNFVRCPPVTPIPFPTARSPKVVYVLIDRSGSYGAYTQRAAQTLIEGLKLSVEPGDRLHLIWLGKYEDTSKNWLVESVPDMAHPALTPSILTFTPTFLPTSTLTPTITPTPPAYAVLERQALSQTAIAQSGYWTVTANASSVIATNTAIQVEKEVNQQHCNQAPINHQNLIVYDDWQNQRRQLVVDFVENTLTLLINDAQRGEDNATHIYNSLYYAARTIRQEKDTNLFGAYYLILLSDMEDIGSIDGQSLEVDLADVNVLMAMVYCQRSIDCQNRSIYWESYFRDRGAKLPTYPFRLVDETTPYVISDFLK